jgi:hypothetical protein
VPSPERVICWVERDKGNASGGGCSLTDPRLAATFCDGLAYCARFLGIRMVVVYIAVYVDGVCTVDVTFKST